MTRSWPAGSRGGGRWARPGWAARGGPCGSAGVRAGVGAGPTRMNRAVVRAATAAVAGWLVDGGGTMDVVVGCDARHRSDEFADEVARVLAGAGIRVHLL